ncbi:MAG: Flp pilus assembly complex ATPase component TadA [Solirubrobacteraceae bacterium]|nr:Flp pilus assembly complex ATPase component TadA [Solirubrobacteraceae bacterium]
MSEQSQPQPMSGADAAAAAAANAMRAGATHQAATVVAHPGTANPTLHTADGASATIHQLPGATSGWVPTPRRRLGDIVVDAMWVPRNVVEEMVGEARELGRPIGQLLLDRGYLTSEQLGQAIAERFGLPYLTLRGTEIEVAAATLIDAQTARRLRALPVAYDDDTLVVGMVDPGNIVALDDIAMLTGQRVRPIVVADEDLDVVIARVLGVDSEVGAVLEQISDDSEEAADLRETTDDEGPTVKIVQSVLAQAVERHASDVHFDPTPQGLKVRFRIDGVVHEATSVPRALAASVISRLKILAELNIAERRMPQDGRVGFQVEGRRIDLRVVTLPLVDGESVVLRILDSGGTVRGLSELGMRPEAEARLERALSRSNGGILATGPTGSGKTTTVYGALDRLNTGDRTIITIEDPVEYRVAGIKQLQINPKIGLEFGNGLRAMVRADPDVMLVGEIRDSDSAQIAMQAAITGHLVLSTLHTNNAATALSRLVDMGVPSFMVVSAVSCVVGQRLARRLCEHCKEPGHVPAELLDGEPGTEVGVFHQKGCNKCNDTGYEGRIGLYEVLEVTDEIRKLVVSGAGADQIQTVARAEGMQTMREDGIQRVREGLTSVDELARVVAV